MNELHVSCDARDTHGLPIMLLNDYNPFLVYCRELAPGTVSLTCDRAQGDDNKHDSHYTYCNVTSIVTNVMAFAEECLDVFWIFAHALVCIYFWL